MKSLMFATAVALSLAAMQEPQLSDTEQLKRENLQLRDQLRAARAQRADCEATLGPLEVQARSTDLQAGLQKLKAECELSHPGFTCDPAAGTLTKKPEPPK